MIETKLELANVIAECQKSRVSIRLYIKKIMLFKKLEQLRLSE